MTSFFLLSLPIFCVVALGWAAVQMRLTPPTVIESLGAFSFRFALPALVLRLIVNEPLAKSFNLRFFTGYLVSGGLIFGLTFAASRVFWRKDSPFASARATTATVSNLGFLGPPIVLAFLGPLGAGPLAMAIICEVMILMSLGAVLMAGGGSRSSAAPRFILGGIIRNPVIGAILGGNIIAASGVSLPAALDSFLAYLGASAGPTALFAVGGALGAQRIDPTTGRAAAGTTLIKLIIYPLTAWCMLTFVARLDPFWVGSGVLIAALPSASSSYLLAQRYEADANMVSAGIVLSTIVSVTTVPLAGWLMLHS